MNPTNDLLQLAATDDPGVGGANHRYEIWGCDYARNPSAQAYEINAGDMLVLLFQNGPINEVGVNGITHEVLLSALIDRLRGFEEGPYACHENAMALSHLRQAQDWLQLRTKKRMARGVEGTLKV